MMRMKMMMMVMEEKKKAIECGNIPKDLGLDITLFDTVDARLLQDSLRLFVCLVS